MESAISGFYKKTVDERLVILREQGLISDEDIAVLKREGPLPLSVASRMIENVIGTVSLPLGVATYFRINGRDCLIPMAIEEPSVVAAASFAAKLARESGGFTASATEPVMIGQVQLVGVESTESAKKAILEKKNEILELANSKDATLVKLGGGARDIEVRGIGGKSKILAVHLLVDVRDAMGANAVNTMSEAIAPLLEQLSGGKARLRIISNLAVYRKAHARAVWKKEVLEESVGGKMSGEEVVEAILQAYEFAVKDPFRCATHNKGIMNGIDALAVATGNDWRAIEAGVHSYACFKRKYSPLTRYKKNRKGDLEGEIELPLAFGIVGGATRTSPTAQISLKILGVKSAQELAQVAAALGLAQNFAALRALATEGIQRGHMELHARNIAITAGASGSEADIVAKKMIEEKNISVTRAKEILSSLHG
ncbi:MAG: hydroxymethylglutaryl-CoA reductase, degradative [Candidatus Micrarchaeia archaeon]